MNQDVRKEAITLITSPHVTQMAARKHHSEREVDPAFVTKVIDFYRSTLRDLFRLIRIFF